MFGIISRAAKLSRLKKTLRTNLLYAAGYIATLETIDSDEGLVDAIKHVSILVLEDFQAFTTFDEMEPPIACIITPNFTLRPTPTSNNYLAWFSMVDMYDALPSTVFEFSNLCSKMVARRALAASRTRAPERISNAALDQDARKIVDAIATYVIYSYARQS